jgi:hypothetical protein
MPDFYVNILLNIIIIFKKFNTIGVAFMRKPLRKSFNQLVHENKQSLLRNKEEIEKIESKIEKRHELLSEKNKLNKAIS